MKNKKIVIGCSIRFRDLIRETMRKFEELGFTPLFPNLDHNIENGGDVGLTIEDKTKLVWDHYYAVEEADAVYFILPEGYMGTSCKVELGYALALKKPVYFSELTNDMGLDCFCKKVISLNDLNDFIDELK